MPSSTEELHIETRVIQEGFDLMGVDKEISFYLQVKKECGPMTAFHKTSDHKHGPTTAVAKTIPVL